MANVFFNILLLALSSASAWFSYKYLSNFCELGGIFFAGLIFGIFLMNLKLNVKNSKISSYQRQLEKEAISSSENSSRVKVLESKIQVLEKALENALNRD